MDGIELCEKLMALGWWREAEAALYRPDVSTADRLLQGCALVCRRECVEWVSAHADLPAESVRAALLRRFDVYTVNWTMREYRGDGALIWRAENARASDRMD